MKFKWENTPLMFDICSIIDLLPYKHLIIVLLFVSAAANWNLYAFENWKAYRNIYLNVIIIVINIRSLDWSFAYNLLIIVLNNKCKKIIISILKMNQVLKWRFTPNKYQLDNQFNLRLFCKIKSSNHKQLTIWHITLSVLHLPLNLIMLQFQIKSIMPLNIQCSLL